MFPWLDSWGQFSQPSCNSCPNHSWAYFPPPRPMCCTQHPTSPTNRPYTPHPTLHLQTLTTRTHYPSTGIPKWQTVLAMSTNGHSNALEVTGLVFGVIFTGLEFLIWILQRGQCPRGGRGGGWWDSPNTPLHPFPHNHTLFHPFPPASLWPPPSP